MLTTKPFILKLIQPYRGHRSPPVYLQGHCNCYIAENTSTFNLKFLIRWDLLCSSLFFVLPDSLIPFVPLVNQKPSFSTRVLGVRFIDLAAKGIAKDIVFIGYFVYGGEGGI